MNLERWIALVFLTLSLLYGYSAYHYPLLPFEQNMAFLPNTLPLALSVLGVIVSLIILFSRAKEVNNASTETLASIRTFKLGKTFSLIFAMLAYALLLRPIGFLLATFLFLVGCSILLGERKIHLLMPIAAIAAFGIWYLVQQTLGIFLSPWPVFLGV
jgi:putative tricarboxylic transport membrane protein